MKKWSGAFLLIVFLLSGHLYAVDAQYPRVCGVEGNVGSRVEDCRHIYGAESVRMVRGFRGQYFKWQLVSVTSSGNVIWRDDQTGLVWTDGSNRRGTFTEALRICSNSDFAQDLKAGLNLLFWLPSLEEYRIAQEHGFMNVLRRNTDYTWTATPHARIANRAYYYDNLYNYFENAHINTKMTFRCVAND